MGYPRLFWWPGGDAPLRTLDFADAGEDISDIQETPIVIGETVEMASGSIRPIRTGGVLGVRLVLSNFSDGVLLRELRSLESHLKAGLPIGFTFDADKTWAGFSNGPITAGTTSVITRAKNELQAVYGGPSMPAVGDEVVIESAAPECWREWHQVSAIIGLGAPTHFRTIEAVRFNHSRAPILLREEGTYPFLVLPEGLRNDLLTHTYRRTWTWQVDLWMDVRSVAAAWRAGGDALSGGASRSVSPTHLQSLEGPKPDFLQYLERR